MNGSIRTPVPIQALMRLPSGVLGTGFNELVRCDFPLAGWAPIPVEIPADGMASHFGPPGAGVRVPRAVGTLLHVPRYVEVQGHVVPAEKPNPDGERLMGATPVAAVATRVDLPFEDGMRSRCSSVLMVWASGTSVVVSVDWTEGNAAEGRIGPEWHIRASRGLSVAAGFDRLEQESRADPAVDQVGHGLYVLPEALGTLVLGAPADDARTDAVWGREWRCDGQEALRDRLRTLAREIVELRMEIH